MRVACLIVNYNDYATVESLLNEIADYKCFKKVLVVDNCSTNDSYDLLKKKENKLISVIKTNKNGGYGYGNNFGIKWLTDNNLTDKILICNPDVHFDEKTIVKLCEESEKYTSTVASCLISDIKGRTNYRCAWKVPTAFQYVFSRGIIMNFMIKSAKNMMYSKKYLMKNKVCEVDCVSGSMLLVDAKKMLKYGMYDEEMFLYCEETTLGTKLKTAGEKTILVTDVSYIHEHAVSVKRSMGTSYKGFMKIQSIWTKSKLLYLKKYKNMGHICLSLVKVYLLLTSIEALLINRLASAIK